MALLALIVSAVVLVLQIITLALVAGQRKPQSAPPVAPQQSSGGQDRFERKDQDFRRHERRPFQDQRPRQQQAPQQTAAGEQVDKSLRDINLRLKNAERDQEFARRRIQQEGLSQDQQRGGGRDFRGGRDHRGNRHDRHRDRNRGGWQDRQDRHGPQQQGAPQVQQPGAPAFERKEQFPPSEPEPQKPLMAETQSSEPAVADFSQDDSLQHGRKIMVKRRMLRDETQPAESAGGPAPESVASAAEETSVPPVNPTEETHAASSPAAGAGEAPDSEITFGRRKSIP